MSTKTGFAGALLLTLLGVSAVQATDPPSLLYGAENAAQPVVSPPDAPPPAVGSGPFGPSNWITYRRSECCGPLGGNGPLNMEVYLRTGLSLPVHGELFAHTVETGWFIEGGGRTLFFNQEGDRAWTLDVSIGNIYNNGNRPNLVYSRFGAHVTTRTLNRTFVGLSGGREWYLLGSANDRDVNWRIGGDVGGRWGSARLDLNDVDLPPDGFERHSHVIGGLLLSLHTDFEIPWGCCIFQSGVRVEWDYTWMNFIADHNNDLQDVNILLSAGIRF